MRMVTKFAYICSTEAAGESREAQNQAFGTGKKTEKSRIGFLIVKLNINTKTGDALIVMMAGFATARWFAICDRKITE